MPDFYTWVILLNNQSKEIGEKQLSVFGLALECMLLFILALGEVNGHKLMYLSGHKQLSLASTVQISSVNSFENSMKPDINSI